MSEPPFPFPFLNIPPMDIWAGYIEYCGGLEKENKELKARLIYAERDLEEARRETVKFRDMADRIWCEEHSPDDIDYLYNPAAWPVWMKNEDL